MSFPEALCGTLAFILDEQVLAKDVRLKWLSKTVDWRLERLKSLKR